MPSVENYDYERLAKFARRRRAELGLALNASNAQSAGTSKGTWQRVEKGLPLRKTNYWKFDKLLQWAGGSCLEVLDGGDPITVEGVIGASGVQKSPVPQDVIDKKALATVQLALIATAKGTPAEEIREMSERIVRDLSEEGLL
ncbi:hypothetical protein [Streptomyces ziwulingensis]|uniref:XRE family transcriptional regulator n=1 Tax=Streptomyces ziwulingensis TaxID=1045501 RepID=A0ABP9CZU7_9ACTN